MTGARMAARLVARARRPSARSEHSVSVEMSAFGLVPPSGPLPSALEAAVVAPTEPRSAGRRPSTTDGSTRSSPAPPVAPLARVQRPESPIPPSIGPQVAPSSTTVVRPSIPVEVETRPALRLPEALVAPPAGSGAARNLVGAQPADVPARHPAQRPGPSAASAPVAAHAATTEPAARTDASRAPAPHREPVSAHPNPIGRRLEAAAGDHTTAADRSGAQQSTQRAVADLRPAAWGLSPATSPSPAPAPAAPVVIGSIEIVTQPAAAPAARPDPLAPLADRRRHGRRRIGPRHLSR
jgi:hypothetical protein